MSSAIFYNDSWTLASVFDAAGNVVQFNVLIAGETGFEMEPINQEHTAGDYQSGDRNRMMLACSDFEGEDQISSWKHERTPLKAVALSQDPNGRNMVWPVWTKAQRAVPNPKAQTSEGDAFLHVALNDFYVDPKRVRNLIEAASGTSLVLPISGVTLTLAGTGAGVFDLTLTAKNFAGATLDTITTSFNAERGSVELLLPANTWSVEWSLGGASDGSLRADGETSYAAG